MFVEIFKQAVLFLKEEIENQGRVTKLYTFLLFSQNQLKNVILCFVISWPSGSVGVDALFSQ